MDQNLKDKDNASIQKSQLDKGFLFNLNGLYQGGLKNGKKEGNGKIVYENGDCYEGSWANNEKNGHGI